MQNDQMTVRGYSPQQNTGRMNTMPYQTEPSFAEKVKAIWNQLDPAAVMLLTAAMLGLAYALYATISFWWLTKVLTHIILVWVTVALNCVALFSGKRELMLASALCYVIAMLLFINYLYLLIPQALLCAWAWWRSGQHA